MIKLISQILTISAVLLMFSFEMKAQLREHTPQLHDLTGPTVKPYEFRPTVQRSSFSILKTFSDSFQMSHTYEMSMAVAGGQAFNQNMYTNSMMFMLSPKMSGRVDLGVAHSPMGNNFMGQQQGPQFLIRNAQLNYQPNEKVSIQFNYSQDPWFSQNVWNPFGNPFSPGRRQ